VVLSKPRIPAGLVLALLLAALFFCRPVEARAEQRRVLLLHSYHQGMLWTDSVTDGFTDRLSRDGQDIEISIEYMDTKRHSGLVHRQRLVDFYAGKYSGQAFDVVAACDDNAFRFALAHHQDVFSGAPLVFCGVNFYDPAMLRGHPQVTGLVENIDIAATLRLALQLHPDTKQVVVVNDTTATGRANRHRMDEILPDFEEQVDFSFLDDLRMTDLTARLGGLGPKSIVLLLSFNRDATGRVYSYPESISRIAEACPVPIYGVWGFYLGRGIVGGQLTTGRSHGRRAAGMALRILGGAKASALPVIEDAPTKAMFDYEQLTRLNIDLNRLPADRTVMNRPEAFFNQNRGLIVTASSICLFLLLVILSLSLLLKRLRSVQRVQKESERQLRESKQSLVQILDSLPDAAFAIDTTGTVLFWNKAVEGMTGVPAEDMVGKGDYEYALPFYGQRRPVMVDLVLQWDESVAAEYLYIQRQGDTLVSETRNPPFRRNDSAFWNTASPLYDSDGTVQGAIQVLRDISRIKRTERELLQAQSYIQNIINSMPSLLVTVTPEGRVTQWNKEAVRKTGITAEKAIGEDLDVLLPDLSERKQAIRKAIRTRQTQVQNKIPRHEDGATRYENVTVYPLLSDGIEGAVIRVDDVTDQAHLERMMLQTEKMLTVGGLAAGMAHEINNPLSGIIGNADLLQRRMQPDQPGNVAAAEASGLDLGRLEVYLRKRGIDTMIGRIREAADRAGNIVNDMLFFSRTSQAKLFSVDLGRLMDKALDLAATDYNLKKSYDFKNIQIHKDYDPQMPAVTCEPNQMQQVFLNLLANGVQAMAESRSTSAETGAGNGSSPMRFVIRIYPSGDTARIEIEDNGPGMPEQIRRRAFEPFFTTKEVGKGTGLGLSVSYFIVTEHHGGSLRVESEPGQGSTFIISLPLTGAKG
jgi:PAS domain S-box-containing protein